MDSKESSGIEIKTIDANQARDFLSSGYKYLDVRFEDTYKGGHVENALNIPYYLQTPEGRIKNPQFIDQVLSVCTKDDNLIVACQSGVRSVRATTDLVNAEFKNVFNLKGGLNGWMEHGFAVHKPHSQEQI